MMLRYDRDLIRKNFKSLWARGFWGKWCAIKWIFLSHCLYAKFSAINVWNKGVDLWDEWEER
jgi:hypothetical protein